MKRLFLFLTAITFSAGLWAQTQTQTVSYLYPVYNTEGDVTSGIKEWQTGNVDATVITGSTSLNAGWYVVTGDNVQTKTLTCNGAVHLSLPMGRNSQQRQP